jgi:hypothetical protein
VTAWVGRWQIVSRGAKGITENSPFSDRIFLKCSQTAAPRGHRASVRDCCCRVVSLRAFVASCEIAVVPFHSCYR